MAETSAQPEHAKRSLYVVHAAPDAWFVRGALLPALGLAAGQVQLTSAPPLGEPFLHAFDRGIAGSRVTAVVISRAFLADEWAQHAELMAHHAALAEEHQVVPIFLDEVASPRWRALRVSLDLRDPDRWDEELARLAELLAIAPHASPELPCPYPGMRSLGEGDGALLVGREREIADVVARLGAGQRKLFLIGPSGSGKSSLVSAGVIPRLTASQPGVIVRRFRPGEHPCRRLAGVVDALAAAGASSSSARPRAVLVVDQLEEAFTLACAEERARFFAELRALEEDGRCASLFCLRADFFGELMGSALWDPQGPDHDRRDEREGRAGDTWLVAPLRGEALRQAIERPALTAGVYLEPGLAERLLADAGDDPGALPILQETMRQLWELRKRRVLSLASYRAMGEAAREVGGSGLAVAMSRCGDACLQALSPGQARIARRVLLRLVSFGHGAADTRRQQPRSALQQEGEPEAELDQVLGRLVESRLVSIYEPVEASVGRRDDTQPGEARIDLVHEALIKAWGRLAGWIEERRAAGQRRRHLEEAASSWVARGRRGGGLLEASELSEARTWRASEDGRELGESDELRQLVAASGRARRWWWVRVATALVGSVAVLIAGALILGGVLEKNRAELERSEAEALALAEEARTERQNGQRLNLLAEKRGAALSVKEVEAKTLRATTEVQKEEVREQKKRGNQLARTVATQRLDADLEKARQYLMSGQPQRALAYLAAVRGGGKATGLALQLMVRAASSTWHFASLPHDGAVRALALSPDGELVATASADRTARLWTLATGEPASAPIPNGEPVTAAAFSSQGSLLVTASADGVAHLWRDGAIAAILSGHRGKIRAVAFSPDGTVVVTAGADETARLWDTTTGAARSPLVHGAVINSLAFSDDGTLLATGGDEGSVRVWNLARGALEVNPLLHDKAVRSLAFDRGGTRLLVASAGEVSLWSWPDGERVIGPLVHRGGVRMAAFSPSGERFATCGDDGSARIWSAKSAGRGAPSPLLILRHGSAGRAVLAIAWSRDGKRLATAGADRMARIWETAGGRPVSPLLEHGAEVQHVVFSRDGAQLITAGSESFARLWKIERWAEPPRRLELRSAALAVAFAPQGERLALGGRGQIARIEDTSGAPGAVVGPLQHGGSVETVAWSPDGARLATAGSDHHARLWDARTGKPLMRLPHDRTVSALAWSPDGARLFTACGDEVHVWNAASGADLSSIAHAGEVKAIAVSRDGKLLATASSDGIRLWDGHSGASIGAPFSTQQLVESLDFHPRAPQLVAGGSDGRAHVWSLDGKRLLSLEHRDRVDSVRYSPDGHLLATASRDGALVRIWLAGNGVEARPALIAAGEVRSVAWRADGRVLAVAGSSKAAELFELVGDDLSPDELRALVARGAFRLAGGALEPVPAPRPPP